MHSRGVQPAQKSFIIPGVTFQSMHSRGVQQGADYLSSPVWAISIHALTRSATAQLLLCTRTSEFQSMHSRGVQRRASFTSISMIGISIHALTRSATKRCLRKWAITIDFNPCTHEECNWNVTSFACGFLDFNPCTHEECNCTSLRNFKWATNFNPCTHEECNCSTVIVYTDFRISIHALTRSATPCVFHVNFNDWDFNPCTHEECNWSFIAFFELK